LRAGNSPVIAAPQRTIVSRWVELLINGKRTPGASTLDVINPATGKLLTQCARADQAQVDAAVAAAKQAFPAWAATPIETRRQALLQIAAALESRTPEFARLKGLEEFTQSKIINMAKIVKTAE
jgi:acyl-CoA reductase-like NAD-dependent aldehyde dehydrogenase